MTGKSKQPSVTGAHCTQYAATNKIKTKYLLSIEYRIQNQTKYVTNSNYHHRTNVTKDRPIKTCILKESQ